MYSSIQLAKKYIQYYFSASNSRGHGMHSPFVFDFIQHVLNNKALYLPPPQIETMRSELLSDQRTITMTDLGAGSRKHNESVQRISTIARTALKPEKYARIFYRLARHFSPQKIVELGTSFGITTAYLSHAVPDAEIHTIEGNPRIAAIARENFEKLECKNIRMHEGNFDEQLSDVLDQLSVIDLVFIDGNHRYGPTMNYFQNILKHSGPDTIMVFDDIHWSNGMENAWTQICAHPSVKCTIDIFFLGFVFFRNEFKVKRNFTIRY